ncbi:pyridoxamine 5'-phosphate oxidase family protein [Pacificimonas sp. WHA3]|uniref:Pyridoxamine 5'-phosphate oxidase family protein n=1 Tax=Pacificimonas pallii TaxID=2827236 RepID=A0ABS6SJ34_9SPHN|nr:pyridoxamine 5'-phosphate oxidase family protein [Pacificimonas pallii]MBV7257882.1 pyridoxamine 5'-phosphate oxidase family protein [Pacificimonas pallii]
MADRSLSQIAAKLKDIDIAMLVTKTGGDGKIAARPMSNNRDVSAEDGTTYHFTTDDGRIDDDLRASSQCGATYSSGEFYAAVQGEGHLIRDRATQEKHWVKDLEAWFDEGLDTDGLILIEVKPARIDWWDGRESGEITL